MKKPSFLLSFVVFTFLPLFANAGIVVTDYNPDIVLDDTDGTSGFAGNWNLEINMDSDFLSINDFRILNSQSTLLGVTSYENRIVSLTLDAHMTTEQVFLGQTIDSNVSFTQSTRVITDFVGEIFWGLRIDDEAGDSIYGFIRLVAPENGIQTQMTVDKYLVETTLNEGIVVVPEPSSFAMIAIGCCLLIGRRRV